MDEYQNLKRKPIEQAIEIVCSAGNDSIEAIKNNMVNQGGYFLEMGTIYILYILIYILEK